MTMIFDDLTPQKKVPKKASKPKKEQSAVVNNDSIKLNTKKYSEDVVEAIENDNNFLASMDIDSLAKHIVIGDIINNPKFKRRGR